MCTSLRSGCSDAGEFDGTLVDSNRESESAFVSEWTRVVSLSRRSASGLES